MFCDCVKLVSAFWVVSLACTAASIRTAWPVLPDSMADSIPRFRFSLSSKCDPLAWICDCVCRWATACFHLGVVMLGSFSRKSLANTSSISFKQLATSFSVSAKLRGWGQLMPSVVKKRTAPAATAVAGSATSGVYCWGVAVSGTKPKGLVSQMTHTMRVGITHR